MNIIEILESHLSVTDAWGGSKLASWRYGNDVLVDGIEDAAREIAKMIARPHKVLDGSKLEKWAARYTPDLFSTWELGPCDWIEFWDWMDLEYPDEFSRFEEWYSENLTPGEK